MWRYLTIAVLLLACSPLQAAEAKVVIAPEVDVEGPEIHLVRIAKFSGLNENLLAELDRVKLGPSPRPGMSVTMPRGTIITRIRSNTTVFDQVVWQIPERVKITRAAYSVQRPQILEALDAYIFGAMPPSVVSSTVDDVRIKTPILVPKGRVSLDFECISQQLPVGNVSMRLLVRVDDELEATVPMNAKVEAEVRMVVTQRALNRGYEVRPEDLREEVRPLSSIHGMPVVSIEDATGRLTSRSLSLSRALLASDLEEKPAVSRGDPVTVLLRTDRMVVTCSGEAREDGYLGKQLTVRTHMTGKTLRGELRNGGVVLIPFHPPPTVTQAAGLH